MSRRETLLNTITYVAFTGLELVRKYTLYLTVSYDNYLK